MSVVIKSKYKSLIQSLLLTGLFVGLYFLLRAIPASQCEFLHYQAVEILEDGSERCEGGAPPFINVRRKPFPVQLELLEKRANNEDGSLLLRFELRGPDARPILPHQLAVTHTERIHLMLVNESMDVYHHLHPVPEADSGIYSVSFFPQADHYRFFAEFVPLRSRQIAIADGNLIVPNAEAIEAGQVSDNHAILTDLIRVELHGVERALRRNRDTKLTLRVQSGGQNQEIPDLQLIMGAYAHVVAFEETLSGYQHMHPIEPDPRRLSELEMDFIFHPVLSGKYRIWVQIMFENKEYFIPFQASVL
jgi:hypothetical protein